MADDSHIWQNTYNRELESVFAIQDDMSQSIVKALKIDDQLAEAHTSLAAIKLEHHWDFAGAKKSFQRAIELNPGYATAHHWYARYFWYTAGFNNAISEAKQALELDPLSPSINSNLGWTYFYARKYDKAIEVIERTIGMYTDFSQDHLVLACAYLEKSKYEDALNEIKKEYGPSSPRIEFWKSLIQARMGNSKKLKEYIYELKKKGARCHKT